MLYCNTLCYTILYCIALCIVCYILVCLIMFYHIILCYKTSNKYSAMADQQECHTSTAAPRSFNACASPEAARRHQTSNMGDYQNHGPLLGSLNTRCRIILGTQKGTIILTTTHMSPGSCSLTRSAKGKARRRANAQMAAPPSRNAERHLWKLLNNHRDSMLPSQNACSQIHTEGLLMDLATREDCQYSLHGELDLRFTELTSSKRTSDQDH